MNTKSTLEDTMLLYLRLAQPSPFPCRGLYAVGVGHGHAEAHVLGWITDAIADGVITIKPDATHGAVYVLNE